MQGASVEVFKGIPWMFNHVRFTWSRFKAPNITSSIFHMDIKSWICLSGFLYSSLSHPSLSHNSHRLPPRSRSSVHQAFTQPSIYSSFHPSNSVTPYIYFKCTNSVDFCVGSCLGSRLPFFDQFSLSLLKASGSWEWICFFFFLFFCLIFCLNENACTFETTFYFIFFYGRKGALGVFLILLGSQNSL